MKILSYGLVVLLTFLCEVCRGADDDGIMILKHHTRTAAYEWWLAYNRIKELPRWKAIKEPPPISLEKAIQISKKWVAKKDGIDPQYEDNVGLVSAGVQSLYRGEEKYRDVFYYKIILDTRPFETMACIVLMDGTVLQPKLVPSYPEDK